MADNIEVPRGRSSAILLLALLTFGSYVLMIVPFLSQHSKYHISIYVVCIWEIIICVAGLVAMVLIIILRRYNEHLMFIPSAMNRKQLVIRHILLIIVGVSASILSFHEARQASTCLSVHHKMLHALQFVSYLCISIYTAFHGVFAPLCYRYRCQSSATRLLVVVILSANATLFGTSVLNTMRALHTQPSQDPLNDHNTSIHDMTSFYASTSLYSTTSLDGSTSFYGYELADNTDYYTNNRSDYFAFTLVYSVCVNGTELIDDSSATMHVHEYTYPLTLEFLLSSLLVLIPLWNITTHRQTISANPTNTNTDVSMSSDVPTEHAQEQPDTTSMTSYTSFQVYTSRTRFVNSLKRACRFVSQHSLIVSLVFATIVFLLHALVEIGNEIRIHHRPGGHADHNLTSYAVGFYYLQTVNTYVISSVPLIGYYIARQRHNTNTWRFDVETALLFLGGCVHILLVIFETVDTVTVLRHHPTSHVTEDVMYFIKVLFHYVGIYFQINFLLKAFCLQRDTGSLLFPDQILHVKGIVIFLGICNAERWLADTFMPPTVLKYANDIQGDDTFGHVNWWVIVQTLYPIVMFYRIWSAIMCVKAYYKLTGHQ